MRTQLAGTTWQQLADYLAVVSLAQIDPEANPAAFDSILNVFSNPAAYSVSPTGTGSYVRALYSFHQERIPGCRPARWSARWCATPTRGNERGCRCKRRLF